MNPEAPEELHDMDCGSNGFQTKMIRVIQELAFQRRIIQRQASRLTISQWSGRGKL